MESEHTPIPGIADAQTAASPDPPETGGTPPEAGPSVAAVSSPDETGVGTQPTECAFPVDLSREEFIRFNVLLARSAGPLRHWKGQLLFIAVMLVMSIGVLVAVWITDRTADPLVIALIAMIAFGGLLILWAIPANLRRSAGRSYDQTVKSGYRFTGVVRVYADHVQKSSDGAVTVIRFSEGAGFMEAPDMMVLIAPSVPSIVIPARCLTAEDADCLRRTALAGIPPTRHLFIGRLVPGTALRQPIHEEKGIADEERMTVRVVYTTQEFMKLVRDTGMRSFIKLLPLYSAVALMSAVVFGLMAGPGASVIAFASVIAALFLFILLSNNARARTILARATPEMMTIEYHFTDLGLTARSPKSQQNVRFGWAAVRRAVERTDSVEFFTDTSFIRIPKRCIPDMNALRGLVDAHVKPPK